MSESKQILALYDCRSKQEYIYRTNRMQEITGGSELLKDVFNGFFTDKNHGFKISCDWDKYLSIPENYLENFRLSGFDAEIIYEGGGNLCVIFKDKETYLKINHALSERALRNCPGISIIASHVEIEPGDEDFVSARKKLYTQNALQKNLSPHYSQCSVMPFTLIDRSTHQPILKRDASRKLELSSESATKRKCFKEINSDNKYNFLYAGELDDLVTLKGEESLLAIIYIDGNNMGEKVKNATKDVSTYAQGIEALRKFSVNTNREFVEDTIRAIEECLYELYSKADEDTKHCYRYRPVIYGGDEINIICNARAVPDILHAYFTQLKSPNGNGNSACAGVAIFHSHAPFADVYEIAEQCCESGKEKAHLKPKEQNFIDFHYCHGGITNSMKTVREVQESAHTARPYEFSTTWQAFMEMGSIISTDRNMRSNLKELSEAIVKGDSYFMEQVERIKSRATQCEFGTLIEKYDKIIKSYDDKKCIQDMLYDLAIVYDLWFRKEGE